MKISFLSHARQDLRAGFHFYDDKESGLGAYFLESLYAMCVVLSCARIFLIGKSQSSLED